LIKILLENSYFSPAHDKAVQSRGLDGNLVDWLQVKEIGTLLDHIVEDNTRVAWF
jgi:hypothetical protein